MGLPRFYGDWLVGYKNLFIQLQQLALRRSSLSIDANALLYELAAEVFNQGSYYDVTRQPEINQLLSTPEGQMELINRLFTGFTNTLIKMLRRYDPKDCLVLCFDGVAPVLKMQHQRQRRFKGTKSTYDGKDNFDTTAFSPGTDLMLELDKRTKKWLEDEWAKGQLPVRVLYSGPSVAGEGEHKIMDFFRDGLILGDGIHIVHGLDSDLSLLCLGLTDVVKNLYLVRDYRYDQRDGIVPIDKLKEAILQTLETDNIADFIALTA